MKTYTTLSDVERELLTTTGVELGELDALDLGAELGCEFIDLSIVEERTRVGVVQCLASCTNTTREYPERQGWSLKEARRRTRVVVLERLKGRELKVGRENWQEVTVGVLRTRLGLFRLAPPLRLLRLGLLRRPGRFR